MYLINNTLSKVATIPKHQRRVTPKLAVEILSTHGLSVTEKEAKRIVNFLYKLAATTIKNEESILIHKG